MPSVDVVEEKDRIEDVVQDQEVDIHALVQYYDHFLPVRYLFQWLNHSPVPTTDFTNREFAFTLEGEKYVRYLSYANGDALKKDILRLQPTRFEIGPQYSANPKDRKILNKNMFKPVSKELVFDIDLTDYDDIRTCCSKTDICYRCWKFITVSIRILDQTLREDFGFKHILWVFSGRRGAHAWISDKRARDLDDRGRRAIVGYLNVASTSARGKVINLRRPLHPYVTRMLNVLTKEFTQIILVEQDAFRAPEKARKLLERIPDKNLRESLQKKWGNSEIGSQERWKDIDQVAKTMNLKGFDANALLEAKKDIILENLYPNLDTNVSIHLNHLLKSPFCVHPKTGNVCVPIVNPETFDPTSVPTVSDLLEELNDYNDKNPNSTPDRVKDYEKTSLKEYIDYFSKFVSSLLKEEQIRTKREREEQPSDLTF